MEKISLLYGKKFNINRCTENYVYKKEKYNFFKGIVANKNIYKNRTIITLVNSQNQFLEISTFDNELDGINKFDFLFVAVTHRVVDEKIYYNPVGIYKVNSKEVIKWDKPRVELQIRSAMSQMDGISSIEEIYRFADNYNFSNIVINDLYSAHGIPEIYKEAKKHNMKPIYSATLNIFETTDLLSNYKHNINLSEAEYVIFDIETTSLTSINNHIIEIGAVKYNKGLQTGTFNELIDIGEELRQNTTDITGITDEDLAGKRSEKDVLKDFVDFVGDAILVGHNIEFDINFLNSRLKDLLGIELTNTYIDTVKIARKYIKSNSYTLDKLAKTLKLSKFNHHRAFDDAMVTAELLFYLLEQIKKFNIITTLDLYNTKDDSHISARGYNINVYVKNKKGLENLYKLISLSHTQYFYRIPKVPYSKLMELKEGLIITNSFDSNSDLIDSIMLDKQNKEIFDKYDYILVGPPEALDLSLSLEEKTNITKNLYNTAKQLNKKIIVVSSARYLMKHQKLSYDALKHYDKKSDNSINYLLLKNDLYKLVELLETDKKVQEDILYNNGLKFVDEIKEIKPLENKLKPPSIKDDKKKLIDIVNRNLIKKYGKNVLKDKTVISRVKEELSSIIKNGYSVLYLLAKMVVDDSESHGYHVGSRGSVGSSLVAHLMGISEVNPLPPHWYCPECSVIEFANDSYDSGYDLPKKKCQKCGKEMKSDGHNIPFQTFLGFEGDKVPDIDLNISGEYQSKSHEFIVNEFGKDNVFRAGTILTIQEKTARMIALSYLKSFKEFDENLINIIADDLLGVKRSSGQHSGGLIIVPKDRSVYEFTPLQYPANKETTVPTTHFAFEYLHDDLVKMDALG